MKKKPLINFSCPAKLSDFKKDNDTGTFSRAKLNVFYQGLTADNRLFSSDFSEKMLPKLKYTPVVGYFSEEDDDFIGHATEQQIFGMVDPCVEPVFETDENDKTWAVVDVVLYTERPDKVGEIAQKIVGHEQSLELNPKTVKYRINYDAKGHFENIEFTDGDFVGLSVLGKNQKPAFTGSSFFTYSPSFEEKMNQIREYCESKQNNTNGAEKMNLNEFIKLSWGEKAVKLEESVYAEYGAEAYTYIVDFYDDAIIVKFYYYATGDSKLFSIKYTANENGEFTLGDVVEVHATYEPVQTPADENIIMSQTEDNHNIVENQNDTISTDMSNNDNMEEEKSPETTEDSDSASEHIDSNDVSAAETDKVESFENIATPLENSQLEASNKNDNNNNQQQTEEQSSSATTFINSEDEELKKAEREEKLSLLNKYKDFLNQDELISFSSSLENFTAEKLELELLKIYKREKDESTNFSPRVFQNNSVTVQDSKERLISYIRKNLR